MEKRLRKIVIMLLAAVFAMAGGEAMAENYLKAGLNWKTYGKNINYNGTAWEETRLYYKLTDTVADNMPCLQIWRMHDDVTYVPQQLLKVEGEKVYVSARDTIDWKLFYDFGVQPGDSIEVYSEFSMDKKRGILVTDIVPDKDYPDLERIEFREYYPSESEYYDEGYWFKGLGSGLGVQYNIGFGMTPRLPMMVEATLDGKVVYSQPLGIEGVSDSPETNDEAMYDLYGRKITKPLPGQIYIRNGRKYVGR